MQLSKQSVETLVDLVENKLSTIEIWDRADKREVNMLKKCLRELTATAGGMRLAAAVAVAGPAPVPVAASVAGPVGESARRRGRPPKARLEPVVEAAQ